MCCHVCAKQIIVNSCEPGQQFNLDVQFTIGTGTEINSCGKLFYIPNNIVFKGVQFQVPKNLL